MRKRQLQYVGHIYIKDHPEKQITEEIAEKRRWGRHALIIFQDAEQMGYQR